MRGWHYESYRHSLAARGISTRARALIRPSGESNPILIKRMGRIYKTINDLGKELRAGEISWSGYDKFGRKVEIYGGLTTSEFHEGLWVDELGDIDIELDIEIMLDYNDLIEVEYTREFFEKNKDILNRIAPKLIDEITEEDMEFIRTHISDERELVSRSPVSIPQESVKKINIRYGCSSYNPLTAAYIDEMTEEESWKLGREVVKEIREKIPRWFWDRIWLINTTTGEEQMLRWLI